MSRSKGQTGAVQKVRAELDGALLALAQLLDRIELVLLRVRQAIRRAGLDSLLSPAVEELERMACDVKDAKAHVNEAAVRLAE